MLKAFHTTTLCFQQRDKHHLREKKKKKVEDNNEKKKVKNKQKIFARVSFCKKNDFTCIFFCFDRLFYSITICIVASPLTSPSCASRMLEDKERKKKERNSLSIKTKSLLHRLFYSFWIFSLRLFPHRFSLQLQPWNFVWFLH